MPPNVEEEEAAKAAAASTRAAAAAAAVVSLLAGIFCVLVSTRHPRLAPAPAPSSSPRISPHARPFQCSFLERMNFDTSRCCVNHSREQGGRGLGGMPLQIPAMATNEVSKAQSQNMLAQLGPNPSGASARP